VARLRAMEERRRNGQLPPPADLAGLVIDERVVIES
jgi:hypothetical protein